MSDHSLVDLHMHTTISDGHLPPRELTRRAHANGVRTLAVTDHDNTDGLAEARAEAERAGPHADPRHRGEHGSRRDRGPRARLLPALDDPAFQARLLPMRDDRLNRAYGMVARLGELGYPISIDRVLEIAGEGSVGRPHVAQALLEAGHVGSIAEAFDRFIADHGPAYVDRMKLSPKDAIAMIHANGGVTSVAHPLPTHPTWTR